MGTRQINYIILEDRKSLTRLINLKILEACGRESQQFY